MGNWSCDCRMWTCPSRCIGVFAWGTEKLFVHWYLFGVCLNSSQVVRSWLCGINYANSSWQLMQILKKNTDVCFLCEKRECWEIGFFCIFLLWYLHWGGGVFFRQRTDVQGFYCQFFKIKYAKYSRSFHDPP